MRGLTSKKKNKEEEEEKKLCSPALVQNNLIGKE